MPHVIKTTSARYSPSGEDDGEQRAPLYDPIKQRYCNADSLPHPVLYRQPMPIPDIVQTLSRTVWPIVNCSRQTVRRDN